MAKTVQSIPGPEPWPLIGWRGNLLKIFDDPLVNMEKMREKYGDIYTLNRGGNPPVFFPGKKKQHTLMVFGAELNRQLLSNTDIFHTGPIVGTLYPGGEISERQAVLIRLNTGVFGMNGPAHRRQRRLVMPAFHKQHLNSYYQDMIRITLEDLDGWKLNEKCDIHREMLNTTLRIIAHCLFGLDVRGEGRKFGEVIQQWFHIAADPAVVSLQMDLPGLPYHRFLNVSHQLDSIFREMVRQRQASGAAGDDVLSIMLSTRDEDGSLAFTENEIIGNCTAFFVAGHETISNTLAWIFFLLSQHPLVMAKLYAELDKILGGEIPTYEQLRELPYLDAVVKENLRILSPTPISVRSVASPVEVGGYELPVGTEIGLSHFHTHHDPAIYEDPKTFDPSRWERITPSAYEYIPFSTGIRTCIGMPFALMEIPLVVAIILQRFRFELAPGANIVPHVGFNLYPKYGMPMIIRATDGNYSAGVGGVKGKIRNILNLP